MLDWKTINGYDNKKDYNWQKDNSEVELPDLGEEILIYYTDETRPDRPPFVGYFSQMTRGVYMIVAHDKGTLFEVQDEVKWARFNRTHNKEEV